MLVFLQNQWTHSSARETQPPSPRYIPVLCSLKSIYHAWPVSHRNPPSCLHHLPSGLSHVQQSVLHSVSVAPLGRACGHFSFLPPIRTMCLSPLDIVPFPPQGYIQPH